MNSMVMRVGIKRQSQAAERRSCRMSSERGARRGNGGGVADCRPRFGDGRRAVQRKGWAARSLAKLVVRILSKSRRRKTMFWTELRG
jgi:hypothetical protein